MSNLTATRTAKLGTTNKAIDPDNPMDISVEIEITVPASLQEAIDFFGGEEKFLDMAQGEVQNRKLNTARPVLRDSTVVLDWASVAQDAAESYEPGRRSSGVEVSRDELAQIAASGDVEALAALLASKGARIA